LDYDSCLQTNLIEILACDGCGQSATPEHTARRLQRLEWSTRYRPVHIGALLLSGISPREDADFLYAGKFAGEAGRVLEAVGIGAAGKSPEAVLSEFQRGGFFLAHLVECPLENGEAGQRPAEPLLAGRLPAVMARIRRSLKPKKVILVSRSLDPVAARLKEADLGCPVLLDGSVPFALDSSDNLGAVKQLRETLFAALAGK
jgi:hypothetical protein